MDFVADGQPFDSCQFLILQMKYCVFVSGKMYKAAVQLDRKNELEALLKKKKPIQGHLVIFPFSLSNLVLCLKKIHTSPKIRFRLIVFQVVSCIP